MDGNQLLMQMKHLGEVESIKDVRPLTAAMFPGTHCPLMGAAMAVRGISDAMMLIIGTDECTYYTKHFSVHAENFGGLNGRCVSVALDGHDVTFGCAKKVEDAEAFCTECMATNQALWDTVPAVSRGDVLYLPSGYVVTAGLNIIDNLGGLIDLLDAHYVA